MSHDRPSTEGNGLQKKKTILEVVIDGKPGGD